jgi:hypothetical protein
VTPLRRLTLAGVGVIGGGAIIAAGTRMTWASASLRPSPVQLPGFPKIVLAGGRFAFDGASMGVGYLFGIGLLIALVPLGWLVAGPRTRVVLAVVAIAAAAGVAAVVATKRADVPAEAIAKATQEISFPNVALRISSGSGIGVTAAGAALAGLSALFALGPARRVPKMRMPEGPPDGGPGAGPSSNGGSAFGGPQ